jgi:hypothetical protein
MRRRIIVGFMTGRKYTLVVYARSKFMRVANTVAIAISALEALTTIATGSTLVLDNATTISFSFF